MPRPINTPAPALVSTADLQSFDRAEMAAEIRRTLCGYPRVELHRNGQTFAYTGKELAAILQHLTLNRTTSAVAYDKDGKPAARVSPVFKKQYAHDGKLLPVWAEVRICAEKAVERWGAYSFPRWQITQNGWGFAGIQSRFIN